MTTTKPAREEGGSLAEHLRSCLALHGPGHRIRCLAEAMHAFVAPRFVTTVCLTWVVLIGAAMAF